MLALIIVAIVFLSLNSLISFAGVFESTDRVARTAFVIAIFVQWFAIIVLSLCV